MKNKLILFIFFSLTLSVSYGKANTNFNTSNPANHVARKYFSIDLHSSDYRIDVVKLNSKSLYNIDLNIELFNLHYGSNKLILFSVLPFKSKQSWTEIKPDTVKLIDLADLKNIHDNGLEFYQRSGRYNFEQLKRDDISIVIKKDGKFFVSGYCITEFFSLVDLAVVFPNGVGNVYINTKSPALSVAAFEATYKKVNNRYSPNYVGSGFILLRPFETSLNVFSGMVELSPKLSAYKFWQFSDWRNIDGLNSYRGIDRFLYVPEIGIVGGSFDFWFTFLDKTEHIQDNYYLERVMVPTSINGSPLN